ncbi:DNA integrity scanning protein DisA nucleotide-binding domain protein [Mesorhizobium sp. M1156]|uniref:putative sensor domain DACNV-containing protein n=1 Tax=Mesorhizobium sp. M1156 TaxID=2957064 RepID=UPI0033394E9B
MRTSTPNANYRAQFIEVPLASFPKELAKIVFERWPNMVAGDYALPLCPPLPLLRQLLEICYLTASAPEESRYPQFNVIALPKNDAEIPESAGRMYRFSSERPLSVSELRRLAPATDIKKSAILVLWDERGWSIGGLFDLGTSWHRARSGLEYRYRSPNNFFAQVDRPGRLRVYQGPYHVASLADGVVLTSRFEFNLVLHEVASRGLAKMDGSIDPPLYEHPKEYEGFEFIAAINTYAAIANAISMAGHGGMIVIIDGENGLNKSLIKLKYEIGSDNLKSEFIYYINKRHEIGDYYELSEDGHLVPEGVIYRSELALSDRFEALVEATRLVASLSGCDGSIVISDDLNLIGFGGEIKAEISPEVDIFEVIDEMQRKYKKCDIEQFGMRHRSAVKLASQDEKSVALVISQDGPISAV